MLEVRDADRVDQGRAAAAGEQAALIEQLSATPSRVSRPTRRASPSGLILCAVMPLATGALVPGVGRPTRGGA